VKYAAISKTSRKGKYDGMIKNLPASVFFLSSMVNPLCVKFAAVFIIEFYYITSGLNVSVSPV